MSKEIALCIVAIVALVAFLPTAVEADGTEEPAETQKPFVYTTCTGAADAVPSGQCTFPFKATDFKPAAFASGFEGTDVSITVFIVGHAHPRCLASRAKAEGGGLYMARLTILWSDSYQVYWEIKHRGDVRDEWWNVSFYVPKGRGPNPPNPTFEPATHRQLATGLCKAG